MSQASNLEWVNGIRALRSQARELVIAAERMSLHAQANDITGEVTASVEGGQPTFDGSDMPLQTALNLVALFGDWQGWLQEATAPGQPSRIMTLFAQE